MEPEDAHRVIRVVGGRSHERSITMEGIAVRRRAYIP